MSERSLRLFRPVPASLFARLALLVLLPAAAGCMKDDLISNADAEATPPKEFLKEGQPVLGPSMASEALAVGGPAAPKPSADAAASAPLAPKDASAPLPDAASPTGCGTKPLPDCPLQGWMRAHAEAPLASGDLPALAESLDAISKMAPPGYTNWASIARDGAATARTNQVDAVKAACRSCHQQYKTKYKAELRDRKI